MPDAPGGKRNGLLQAVLVEINVAAKGLNPRDLKVHKLLLLTPFGGIP